MERTTVFICWGLGRPRCAPRSGKNPKAAGARRRLGPSEASGVEKVLTDKAPAPIGPYNQAIRAGDYLFCSGQIPLDAASGELIGADAAAQTRQVMRNLAAVLEAAGARFEDVVKTTIFLIDMNDFAAVNAVYAESFGPSRRHARPWPSPPCPRGSRVEVEAIAFIG
jgi:2-iminobutanoate/2-iminopropanoate deaminase